MKRSTRTQRLRIERIELDFRGVAPAAAEAAARALGPALARSLAGSPVRTGSAERIEAEVVASPRAPEVGTLANDIAQSIARRIRGRND